MTFSLDTNTVDVTKPIYAIINSLGTTLSNVDDAYLIINGIKMTKMFEPMDKIMD